MKSPLIVDQALLDRISAQALGSARKRKNFNFHHANDDPSHRLLNAIEPDTYVAPHRHLDPNKDETMVMVRGSMGVVFFDDAGAVVFTARLVAGGENVAVNIPCGVYHSIVALESGTVFFESKAGPYLPLNKLERAPWAPAEENVEVMEYLKRLQRLFNS